MKIVSMAWLHDFRMRWTANALKAAAAAAARTTSPVSWSSSWLSSWLVNPGNQSAAFWSIITVSKVVVTSTITSKSFHPCPSPSTPPPTSSSTACWVRNSAPCCGDGLAASHVTTILMTSAIHRIQPRTPGWGTKRDNLTQRTQEMDVVTSKIFPSSTGVVWISWRCCRYMTSRCEDKTSLWLYLSPQLDFLYW